MGVFEKSIPRYVYNPIQRQPEAVPEYYVDDIFDPILNRNVRTALTQKYGNPLLGTVMGYYEGVENALFGQDDKWGILGPGMGILSGFGRSMDKAGDVILGTLTEGVKGITGQGFENPLENIFVEDQDYTGKRALAAMANSMRGLAGGTTVTEEDFGRGWGLPSLGIELATDPSILGGNLTKLSKMPSVVEQLGTADNALGDIGKFLQQYDDVMAKASIDITAPGLRPAIKALRSSFDKHIVRNFATKFTDITKRIFKTDFTDPAAKESAKQTQAALAKDETLATLSEMDTKLESLEKLIEESYGKRKAYDSLLDSVRDSSAVGLLPAPTTFEAEQAARRSAQANEFDEAAKPVEDIPNLSDAEISEAEIAHRAMSIPRRKLKRLIKDYQKILSLDIDGLEAYSKKRKKVRESAVAKLNDALQSRNQQFYTDVQSFIDYVDARGGRTNVISNPYNNDKVYNAYTNFVKKYLNLPDEYAIGNLDEYADTLHDKGFEDYLRNVLGTVLDDGNPEYVYRVDLSPYAWYNATFSENDALNDSIIRAIEEGFPKYTLPQSGVTLSPSQMGKMSDEVLNAGNSFADEVLADVFVKDTAKGVFPKVSSKEEFVAAFKNKDVVDAFKLLVPDKAAREDLVEKMSRLFFPPEEIVGPYGKPIPYDQFRRMKDYEETYSLFRAKGKLNRIDDSGFGADLTEIMSPEELASVARMPWATYTPEMFLQSKSSVARLLDESQNYLLDTEVSNFTKQYSEAFYYYTLGRGKTVTKRGLREKFGTVFDDKILKALESDVADYRRRLDTIRHAIISNSPNSETVFFKDVFDALDEIDRDYLQPANLDLSRSRYDSADDTLSLNAKVYDSESNTVELGETIADTGEPLGEGASVFKKDNYALSSPYKSQYAFDNDTLWTVRQIIAANPQIFRNFNNLKEASDLLSNFVQFKTVDDAFDYAKYVDVGASVSDKYPGLSADTFLEKFQKEVIPLAEEAISKGYAPIPTPKNAQKLKRLDHLVNSDTASAKAYRTMLRGLVDDWGYGTATYVAKDGSTKTYYKFTGSLHPERFVPNTRRVEFTNLLLRQPKFEFEQARKELLFSNDDLFTNSSTSALVQDSVDLSKHFTAKQVSIPKSQKFTTRATEQANFITEVRPATAAELAYAPVTQAELAIQRAKEAVSAAPKERARMENALKYATWDLHHPQPLDALYTSKQINALESAPATLSRQTSDSTVEAVGDDLYRKPHKVWHWFEQIRKAIATPIRAMGLEVDEKTGEHIGRASLRTKRAEEVLSRARTLIQDGVSQSDVRKVMGLLTAQQGDVLNGADFVDEICKEGIVRSAFRTKAAADTASKALQANVNTFNAAVEHDVLKLLERKMSNGNYEVIVTFDTKNKKLVKQIAGAKGLSKAKFVDVEFLKAHALTTEQQAFLKSEKAQKIISYFEEIDEIAKDQASVLGFNFENALHTKHVRDVNPETADYVANDLNNGLDLDGYEEASTLLSNTDMFRKKFKGALGARLRGRRYRGAYWNYDTSKASLFTYDLEKLAKGSLGDGMFANSNYQSFVDLFVNDNFKIKDVFEDVDDFRKFMYQGGSEGKYAGNLKNIDLCYAKYDADGRFVGIHKYNVLSDADLEKALANPDTILVPANVVDTLDKVIRKEIRLSNKAYAFINKHFTIPFKFGVLTNPGFLVGNVSDAYMKQAVTMSEKYGTPVSTELAKVGQAATMYLNLGNKFNAAIEKWQADMKKLGFELTAAESVPEVLAGHAASRKRLTEYVNGTLKGPDGELVQSMLTDDEAGVVLLWTKLQQLQHTSNSLREFDDIADAAGKSEFDIPRSIVDHITQGSGKYSWKKPSTWGVFVNNPVTNGAMNASEFIENTMRGTAILNDLMHEGYTNEQIFKILLDGSRSPEAAATKLVFDVDFADAVNAMYESNFNYERMSDFMEGVGKAMPFPTFFLKNLAYWLELFEKNPQFFDHAITVHESMWQSRDTSEDEILAEAKGRGAVPVGQKLSKFFKGIYKPTPLQSMFGAFNLINEPVENLSYRLHPLISGSAQAVNQALPHSPLTTFLGEAKYRPYSTDMYERNVKQDDENFNPLAYTVHRSNPFERTINTALRTPAKVREGQAQLSDFLPSVFQPDFSKK